MGLPHSDCAVCGSRRRWGFTRGVGCLRCDAEEGEPLSHKAFGDKFDVHAAIGGFLTGVSFVLLIVGAAREPGGPARPASEESAETGSVRAVDAGPDADTSEWVR